MLAELITPTEPPRMQPLHPSVAGFPASGFPMPGRPIQRRPSPGDQLREALLTLAQAKARIASHEERGWASASFAGTRHRLELLFEGPEAVEAGERLIDALPDHEFAIPGQVVADAAVAEVHHALLPSPRLAVAVELFLLVDA